MNMKQNKNTSISRREFLRTCGTIIASGALASVFGISLKRFLDNRSEINYFWQIDSSKCIFCGRCQTACVLPISAVKCVHANRVCGYCDLCGGYYRSNAKELNTAAENLMCPTGAINRKFIEDPYFEYTINERLCIACGKCAKGCNSFGNGSLYLQIKQELCKNCNECAIAKVCPADAIKRVTMDKAYDLKNG